MGIDQVTSPSWYETNGSDGNAGSFFSIGGGAAVQSPLGVSPAGSNRSNWVTVGPSSGWLLL